MKREPVDSEAMRSVGYDRRRHVLEIEFERGSVYRYLGVPAAVHDDLRAAQSLGAFFGEHIRDAGYLVERVNERLAGEAAGPREPAPGRAGRVGAIETGRPVAAGPAITGDETGGMAHEVVREPRTPDGPAQGDD